MNKQELIQLPKTKKIQKCEKNDEKLKQKAKIEIAEPNLKETAEKSRNRKKTKLSTKSWIVPHVTDGGGVQVGGLERPGTYQPSPLRKKTTVSESLYIHDQTVNSSISGIPR